ncbi:MAG: TetR/AcrR family transcriptional regulator [Anaerolineales bacterium]|nr:TetR/AcrR family transcriptional regulator [Anaerolineales bacterium]
MPYRSSEKTRQKKDAKRTTMMQAAVHVFAQKGYHAATVRDVVKAAGVAIGTFYFYFPDKETLFVHLYEETAQFLAQTIRQAVNSRSQLPHQLSAGLQAYLNIAEYEPAVVQLLLVGGIGAVPSLAAKRTEFRESLITIWKRLLDVAQQQGHIPPQNTRRVAEALTGAYDEVVLNVIGDGSGEREETAVEEMILFTLRAVGYRAETAVSELSD